jgi:predicted metal-dependent hydrolase
VLCHEKFNKKMGWRAEINIHEFIEVSSGVAEAVLRKKLHKVVKLATVAVICDHVRRHQPIRKAKRLCIEAMNSAKFVDELWGQAISTSPSPSVRGY